MKSGGDGPVDRGPARPEVWRQRELGEDPRRGQFSGRLSKLGLSILSGGKPLGRFTVASGRI